MIEHLLQAERALANGLLDQAEALYRSAADADARNAIAVVGLARVAVERGEESRALELAQRALEIDPENSAAQRLVARIREVRAYRGEAVEGWTPEEVLEAAPKTEIDVPANASTTEPMPQRERAAPAGPTPGGATGRADDRPRPPDDRPRPPDDRPRPPDDRPRPPAAIAGTAQPRPTRRPSLLDRLLRHPRRPR